MHSARRRETLSCRTDRRRFNHPELALHSVGTHHKRLHVHTEFPRDTFGADVVDVDQGDDAGMFQLLGGEAKQRAAQKTSAPQAIGREGRSAAYRALREESLRDTVGRSVMTPEPRWTRMSLTDSPIDLGAVQLALRAELAQRGHHLSSDTAGVNRALYVMGPNDVAIALFEFKPSADDAVYELMYQGAWVAGLPPRFAVVPADGAGFDSLETLTQMKAIPLLFDVAGGEVNFRDLDAVLGDYLE